VTALHRLSMSILLLGAATACGSDESIRIGGSPSAGASGSADGGEPAGGRAGGGTSGDGGASAGRDGGAGADAVGAGGTSGDAQADPVDASADAVDANAGGGGGTGQDSGPLYEWKLPPGFPKPMVPADNPMSQAKVELGRHLFYDVRLSGNQTQSCASCHRQYLAFTDGAAVSTGSTGQHTPRNSMTLVNVGYNSTFTWSNPLLYTLEQQALVPILGAEPVELGLRDMEAELARRLRADTRYQALFAAAYPAEADPFTLAFVTRALSSFQRALISAGSAYDRFTYGGDPTAMSASAQRGLALFNSEKLECFHCHSGFNFQDSLIFEGKPFREVRFHNTGLYNIDGRGAYPAPNTGVHGVTGRPEDMGRFRVPTLRNIAVTAPYMHDGSIATLSEVLDHYAAGGRSIQSGPNAGNGSLSPLKSPFMIGFTLSDAERSDVLSFFDSLTDQGLLTDPRFSDPWPSP
jgi:cytochrome c peroxidase